MPVIKPTCVRDLKLRVNIADVVSRVVTLRKAGSRLKGLCPFHNEKSPSFHVDPDKGFYKCFGCGKAGDVITFVRETEQLGFTEAVEAIGQRFAVEIEYEQGSGPSREERSLRQEIFEIHELAAEHYHQSYKAHTPTGDYLRKYWVEQRKFAPELAEEFKIGGATPVDDGLGALLLKRKFSEEALRQCGLFFMREQAVLGLGSLKPRFRGRLMIPIRDHQGRVVAFTARQTDLTPGDDPSREAKYVNSPETPIFTKGNLLFNLDRARTAVGEGHPFVLVEGQLDALRCWSVGLKTAIAPQGTSITETQLVLIRRYHNHVECFFDGDGAGQKAAMRFLPMALKAKLEITFLGSNNDEKLDPDLLFQERGLAAYRELQKNAFGIETFIQKYLLRSPETASIETKTRAIESAFDIISSAESEITQKSLLVKLAPAFGQLRILPHSVEAAFLKHKSKSLRHDNNKLNVPKEIGNFGQIIENPEYNLLIVILHFEHLGPQLAMVLPHEWIDLSNPAGVLLNRFLAEFEHGSWPGRDHLDDLLETPEEKALVASLLFDTPAFEDPVKVADEGLRMLRARALEPRLQQIELDLANHQADSETDPISLLKERSNIHRQLRQPLTLNVAD
ncbi:MAG: DNA primase [Cephaloticoccus sp.]|nr:DNA primase [Cephaloticoccus sp.]MCF7760348.1 DNA primase [Cephaloticoccus sp.]